MKTRTFRHALITAIALGGAFTAGLAKSDTAQPASGTSLVYRGIDSSQVEQLTPPARIASLTQSSVDSAGNIRSIAAPTAIWQALEHAEKVECMECIPSVGQLLYDAGSAKNREIAAWWLRRRIFGVFGAGEVYQQVTQTLSTDPNETKRAYAAEALGEFLEGAGVPHVATALVSDSSAMVRAASARALARLNSGGPNGEVGTALRDSDEGVRFAALTTATHINVFTDLAGIARMISDSSATIRNHAALALGAMHAKDAVAGLIALTSPANEPDAQTRASAVFALGQIADTSARNAVVAAQSDSDTFVRDAAAIALRRL